ncbi:hypothetical protein HNQ07_004647 [Deinococcus metalli]|uniref:Cyclic nucleotide-binding domain-containing protein n=1 Tax=Deinococcus metalli TaxID=1141878 RepID=A0A7W8NUA7_9DEIO|nr:hypothetical protein [Deinococcus metalli]MBB5379132.1 hypothetical protein [Deinococcus metalli]GHF65018.1 hypothetical protein GCM10017781_46010 [Deinococcus metalli]
MIYHRVQYGPDASDSFMVVQGMVALIGEGGTVTLPAGIVWPGSRALPSSLMDQLQLAESQLSAGARTAPCSATPRDLEVAVAPVTVQVLRSGPLDHRLEVLAQQLDVNGQAVETTGHLLGAARESVNKRMPRYRSTPD